MQTNKSGLHLLFTADILKQLVANLVPPYQAARSTIPVGGPSCGTPNRNIVSWLTCLDEKVEMYKRLGFVDLGMSDSVWGGEEWHEMTYYLKMCIRDRKGHCHSSVCMAFSTNCHAIGCDILRLSLIHILIFAASI